MLRRVPVAVRVESARTRSLGVSAGRVRAAAEAMLRAMRLDEAVLSIVLCDDRRMRELNRDHRGKDKTTDVLAFALREGASLAGADPRVLGDVVISLPTAARQARAAGKATIDEVQMLLAHGLLHLLGDDHRTLAQTRRMAARTDALRAAATARPQPSGGTRPVRRSAADYSLVVLTRRPRVAAPPRSRLE